MQQINSNHPEIRQDQNNPPLFWVLLQLCSQDATASEVCEGEMPRMRGLAPLNTSSHFMKDEQASPMSLQLFAFLGRAFLGMRPFSNSLF